MNSLTIPEVTQFSCEKAYQDIISCLKVNDLRPGKRMPPQCEVI